MRSMIELGSEKFFKENGYLILPGFFTQDEIDLINLAVDSVWNDKSIYNPLTISAYTGTAKYVETYIRKVSSEARKHSYKLNHLYLSRPDVLKIISKTDFCQVLTKLLGGAPLLFNGLNMEYGTEQRLHFDTFYMPPPKEGAMVASWIALEDIHPDSGPLRYVPGSHLIPPYRFSHGAIYAVESEMYMFDEYISGEIKRRGLREEVITPRKGDVFIWHAQLYHGGTLIKDPRKSRRSMVNHFWRSEDYPNEKQVKVSEMLYMMLPGNMCIAPNFIE
jgi:phytanoyl-CoA hydroxylase